MPRRLPSSLRPSPIGVALVVLLAGIGVWAFTLAQKDWRYQLAGLADPFLGRPTPVLTVIAGAVLSAFVVGIARAVPPVGRRTARWLVLGGWGGYLAGSAVMLAGAGFSAAGFSGYPASVHLAFGSPLNSVADVRGTCRPVVGRPDEIAQLTLTADGLPSFSLRDAATGQMYDPVIETTRIKGAEAFQPPNVPDRPAPYYVRKAPDGTTIGTTMPITFLHWYDFGIGALSESGLTGVAHMVGTRSIGVVPSGPLSATDPSIQQVNMVIANDPWPATFAYSMSWTCGTSAP
jgi:hypothetical protein